MFFKTLGNASSRIRLIWLHGWGVDHSTLMLLATQFLQYDNYLIDFAGFGQSEFDNSIHDLSDYTKTVYDFIKKLDSKITIVIGHSFGGRVAIKLASEYKDCLDGIILLAGAGLKYRRNIWFGMYATFVEKFAPIIKKIFPFIAKIKIGSSDYRNLSREMKDVFNKVIKEDLSDDAKKIKGVPTLLIYGEKDTAAPSYFGEEYHEYIDGSQLDIISGADHFSILFDHNKQTQYFINKFLKEKINVLL